MFIHFYSSLVPNSGDIRRIKNINKELSEFYGTKSIEVSFYGVKDKKIIKKWGKFKVNETSEKKLYVPLPPKVHIFFPWYQALVLAILGFFYHAQFAVGEMVFSYKFKEFFKFFNPKSKIIADIHGARVEEMLSVNPDSPMKEVDKERKKERYTVDSADNVLCQSDEMKKYIVSNYNQKEEKICVYRCGYETSLFNINLEKREESRKELGIADDEILFVYAGGLHKWQKIEESLQIFSEFHGTNPKSKFLILTGDQAELETIINDKGFNRIKSSIISFSVPFAAVSQYLNAADIAFLIRDNHTMNAVASPTKLAEYLACGLPILTSEVAKCWVNSKGLPYLLFVEEGDINQRIVEAVRGINKKTIEVYAINNLSLDIDRHNIKEYLKSIKR